MEEGKKCFYLGVGKICKRPPRPWWNVECSRAVAIKRRAFQKWRRRPERIYQLEYRRLEAKAKKIIKKYKRISFREFCRKLSFSTSATEVWNFIKNIQGSGVSQSFPLTKNGVTLIDDMAKAEEMASFYNSILGVESHLANRAQINSFILLYIQEPSALDMNKKFTMEEMKSQVGILKKGKGIGNDMIANELILNLLEDFQRGVLGM